MERGEGSLSININGGGQHTLTTTHTTRVTKKSKNSMHLAVKERQLNKMWATKRRGKKYPGKLRRSFGNLGKMRREKHISGHGVMEQVAVKESKLSLADTASLLLVFGGMAMYTHCHYYLRVGLRGSVQSHLTRLYQPA